MMNLKALNLRIELSNQILIEIRFLIKIDPMLLSCMLNITFLLIDFSDKFQKNLIYMFKPT